MAQPAGQNKLPMQTPNNNTPVVSVDVDVSTQLKDSQGKPITGMLQAFGYITPGWRYLMGRFLTSVAPVGGGNSTIINDAAVWANTAGTQLKDLAWSVVTQTLLTLFTALKQGVVPASGGGTANFLRADGTWSPPVSGLVFLGTVGTVSNAIVDTTILAANSSTYKSFKLILRNIIPGTNAVTLSLQVHSGGSFQNTSYISNCFVANSGGTANSTSTTGVILCQTSTLFNANPGLAAEITVSNLAGTTNEKQFFGNGSYANSATIMTATFLNGIWTGGNGAIDGFQIVASSGNITSGNVDIYGVL